MSMPLDLVSPIGEEKISPLSSDSVVGGLTNDRLAREKADSCSHTCTGVKGKM